MTEKRRSLPFRLVQSIVLAAPVALILGALTLMAPMLGTLGAAVLLVVALRLGNANRPAAIRQTVRATVQPSTPTRAPVWSRWRGAAAGAASLMTLIVGLGCAVFALTGSNWAPMITDSTHAMNLGLAGGALAAIPVSLAGAMVLTPRFGSVMRWSALLCCVSLIVVAIAQLLGAGNPTQWPLILAAATLMGFAVALPFGRLVLGARPVRIGVTAVLGLAGSIIGLNLVMMAAFIAPLAAAALLVWSVIRLSAQRKVSSGTV
jgi:cytochrome c-type biogenesis protein CcmF